jgi:hypothetical protein
MGAPIRLPRFGGANHAYGHDNRSRAIRAHLAEFGVIAPVGRKGIEELLGVMCPMLCVHALPRWAANCSASKSKS